MKIDSAENLKYKQQRKGLKHLSLFQFFFLWIAVLFWKRLTQAKNTHNLSLNDVLERKKE